MTDRSFYTVALYLVDRAYGGPEEGGWYYTTEEVVQPAEYPEGVLPQVFSNKAQAHECCAALNDRHGEDLNYGLPPIHSVSSRGRFTFLVRPGWPQNSPQTIPHYE